MNNSAHSPARANDLRQAIRQAYLADEGQTLKSLIDEAHLDAAERAEISARAAALVRTVRDTSDPTMMESFLAEYGLSTREGVALMCLAEALLRVPDAETIDALIEDKVTAGRWSSHIGQSSSTLVNASTWALMLTGKVIDTPDEEGVASTLRSVVKRLGEPVVRTAVGQSMRELGRQFVLGRSIEEAMERADDEEERGYAYSYDMLGEAARTEADARRYHLSYSDAITALAPACRSADIRDNPGISVKLSALHPRYEFGQRERVMSELVARTRSLALLAKSANMGFNIDAEEADRLDLSLDVIEAVLSEPALAGWDGFGVVVQAYGRRAGLVLDWLHELACRLDRKIMVRLVKGAYWDTEIKRAQVLGLDGFPVFTRKVNTDVAYICCARKLLKLTDCIYPQFATHNAHSVASVLQMAPDLGAFEFQRLHGMGEALHDAVLRDSASRCRIYAPVGAHKDLLAYLVRRLLENGANSSFVNQIVDESIAPEVIARDPFDAVEAFGDAAANPKIAAPDAIFGKGRVNARGWDITDTLEVEALSQDRDRFDTCKWTAAPMIGGDAGAGKRRARTVMNPARPGEIVGHVEDATAVDVEAALVAAGQGLGEWSARTAAERARCVRKIGDLYEANVAELLALAAREAGKSWLDGIGEVREAVDFARYYANEAERLGDQAPRGIIACISPWNFPLAIFTGQIAAALAAGNAVIAKPAEQTSLMAARAVALMHEAGIPEAAIQLLPGDGPSVGGPLTSEPRITGVCFTGSTETAQLINRTMAAKLSPEAPLIAETGGLNAMIVDSTALPEQAVRDILASAFQSAGQRCSALRMLYVQEDVADGVLEMLYGAMDELQMGDPWELSTDVGPVIDAESKARIDAHCEKFKAEDRLLKRLTPPDEGLFVPPTALRVSGIEDLEEEIFGPVLHIATFGASEIDAVVDAVNAKGFGLTFGLHTRVDSRVQHIVDKLQIGNIYVNRNQIGAVVGSQPFGGEGLSGTGPKAGGPHYVRRFMKTEPDDAVAAPSAQGGSVSLADLQSAIEAVTSEAWAEREDREDCLSRVSGLLPGGAIDGLEFDEAMMELPGPTGESNRLALHGRGVVLCLGPGAVTISRQAMQAVAAGNGAVLAGDGAQDAWDLLHSSGAPVVVLEGLPDAQHLTSVRGLDAVACRGDEDMLRILRQALAERDGMLVPLITEAVSPERYQLERHLCIDTTAAGGNASLLAATAE